MTLGIEFGGPVSRIKHTVTAEEHWDRGDDERVVVRSGGRDRRDTEGYGGIRDTEGKCLFLPTLHELIYLDSSRPILPVREGYRE